MATIVKYNSDLALKENLIAKLESRFQTTFETNDSNLAILADVIGDELISIRNESIEIVEQSQIETATGETLDELAFNMYGFTRRPPSRADSLAIERNVYFYAPDGSVFGDINGGQDIVIPRGTRISNNEFFQTNDTSTIYTTDEEYILRADLGVGYVGVRSDRFGFESNVDSDTLSFHEFEGYANYNQGQLKVTNRYPILNGSDEETDNNFRFKITNFIQASTNLNIDNLSLASLDVNGLAEARILPNYYGIGTVGVVLFGSGNRSNERLKNIFQNRISEMNYLNRKVIVSQGIKVFVDLKLKVFLRKNAFSEEEKRILKRDIKTIIYESLRDQENSSFIDLNEVTELVKQRIGGRDVVGFGNKSNSRNRFEEVFLRKTDRDNLFPEEKDEVIGSSISLEDDERLSFGIIEVDFEEA